MGSRKKSASFFEDIKRIRMIESLEKEILKKEKNSRNIIGIKFP
ncbi:MAG: hypothetical protein ACP5T1_07335 [Thermoplasmata archaeon]